MAITCGSEAERAVDALMREASKVRLLDATNRGQFPTIVKVSLYCGPWSLTGMGAGGHLVCRPVLNEHVLLKDAGVSDLPNSLPPPGHR